MLQLGSTPSLKDVTVIHGRVNSCIKRGLGFVFITSQCSYFWRVSQDFRASGDSLVHGHIFYSQNDKWIFSDTVWNISWKYFPLVMLCGLPTQAKLTSHWYGWRPDKEVSTGPWSSKSSSSQHPLHGPPWVAHITAWTFWHGIVSLGFAASCVTFEKFTNLTVPHFSCLP